MTKNFYDTDTKKILTSSAGSNISNCISEACVIALTEGIKVEFEFNDKLVSIDPTEIVNLYYKRFRIRDE